LDYKWIIKIQQIIGWRNYKLSDNDSIVLFTFRLYKHSF
jgi:hypothetical protein